MRQAIEERKTKQRPHGVRHTNPEGRLPNSLKESGLRCNTAPMRKLLSLFILSSALGQAQNAVQVSGYFFQNTLNSQRVGSAALTASNPSGNNRFVTDTVFGQTRTVYDVTGSANPRSAQGGLTYQAKDKVPRNNYSMEFVFAMSAGSTGWRRIYGCVNLTRGEGLYLDPSGFLAYYSGVSSTANDKLAAGTLGPLR